MKNMRVGLVAVVIITVSGCTEPPVREYGSWDRTAARVPENQTPAPPEKVKRPRKSASVKESDSSSTTATAKTTTPSAGPAVIALLDQAKHEAANGDGDAAAATLERAIGIEPKNPWLWHRLAVLRLQQSLYQQAIELATKSNSLAGDHSRLLGGNWKVIAGARKGIGDMDGAAEAQEKSERFFGNVGGQ